MKAVIKVHANSRNPRVISENGVMMVYVSAPAIDGKANNEVVKTLSEYYDVAPSLINIIKGKSSKIKVIELPD